MTILAARTPVLLKLLTVKFNAIWLIAAAFPFLWTVFGRKSSCYPFLQRFCGTIGLFQGWQVARRSITTSRE